MRKFNPIIISGNAQVGKDTLYTCLEKIFKNYGIQTIRHALADDLKADINQFSTQNYGISAYTKDLNEKELIRPLMVVHGKIKRKQSKGKYWTSLLTPKILNSLNENYLPIITDCRFDEYPEDEVFWAKNILNGNLIYVERISTTGELIKPANEEEAYNEQKLKKAADFKLTWPTTSDDNLRLDFVKVQLKNLLSKYVPINIIDR